jgi:copper chaperone CopZ
VKTEIQLRGANCPVCFETVREMLLEDSRVTAVHSSFSSHCMEVEHGAMSAEELIGLLHRNLHGVEIAGNGEQVMVDVDPSIGEWHCHR